jgi:hypothetical protein
MYGVYEPTIEEQTRCVNYGISCEYGICSECCINKEKMVRKVLEEEVSYIKGKNYFNKEL